MKDVLELLIPIIAIIMVFGTGMLDSYLNYRKRKEMFALYHQQRMAAIEKGVDIPPLPEDFFHEDSKLHEDNKSTRRSPHRQLHSGLILVFTGLTLYLAMYSTANSIARSAAPFALIPSGIGVASLIYYFAVGRKLAVVMDEEKMANQAEASQIRNPRT